MLKAYGILCLFSFSAATEPCGGTLNGVEYDFTPLQKAESNYDLDIMLGFNNLQFNLCKAIDQTVVDKLGCNKQETEIVALLVLSKHSCEVLGVARSAPTLSALDRDGEKGVALTFTNPGKTKEEMCVFDKQKPYQMIVNVVCDPEASTPDKWVASNGKSDDDECSFSADIRSNLGCAKGTEAPTTPTASPTTSAPTHTQVPNKFFDLELDGKLVVDHGNPSKGFTVDEKTDSTIFYPYLVAGGKEEMKITVANIDIYPDTASIGSFFEPQSIDGAVITIGKGNLMLNIDYMCPEDTEKSSDYSVQLTLAFPGEGYDNVTTSWKKTCGPITSAWSTAGLFFFVTFILILVGCVIGCGYNYVQLGKSGCDVIPCIGLLSRCRGNGSASQQGYAAQNDYTAGEASAQDGGAAGGNAYGSTYHSDI